MTSRFQSSFSYYLPILTILLIAFMVRVLYLQEIALNPDESRIFLRMVDSSIKEITTQYRTDNHVFHSLLLYLAAFISSAPFFVRFMTVTIFGTLSIPILYQLTLQLFNRPLALVSGLFLALSAYHIHYAQNLRGYSLLVFLSILSTSLLYQALLRNNLKLWIAFVLVSTINIYTYLLAASMIGVHVFMIAWFWWCKKNCTSFKTFRNAMLALIGTVMLTSLLYSPLFSQILSFTANERHYESDFRRFYEAPWDAILTDYYTAFSSYLSLENYPYLGLVFLIISGIGLLSMFRRNLFQTGWLLIWIIVPYLGVTFAYNTIPRVHLSIRFLQFVIPPILILIAYGILTIGNCLRNLLSRYTQSSKLLDFSRWLPIAIAISLFTGININNHVQLTAKLMTNDWPRASLYLAERASPEDVILCAEHNNSPSFENVKSDNQCTWNMQIYTKAQNKDLSIKRAELALDYSSLIKHPGVLLKPQRVWLIRWNLPPETDIAHQTVFSSISGKRIDIIATDQNLPLIDSAHQIANLQTKFQEDDLTQAVHWTQLSQIQLLMGNNGLAQTSLDYAKRYKINNPEFQTYLGRVEKLLNRSDIIQIKDRYPEHTKRWQFADNINLTGYTYRIVPAPRGALLNITLFWETTNLPSADYTIFIHIVNDHGEKITQKDFRPFGGGYSTKWWRRGDVIWTAELLELPQEKINQNYTLLVGLYNLENMIRLPVLEGDNIDNAARLFTENGQSLVRELSR